MLAATVPAKVESIEHKLFNTVSYFNVILHFEVFYNQISPCSVPLGENKIYINLNSTLYFIAPEFNFNKIYLNTNFTK